MSPAQETLRAAAAGLSAHLIYQVSARILSFAVKAVVIRALKPAHFALVEIRLYLLVGLVLLPCLSGFRPVVLRVPSEARARALLAFCAVVTVILAIIFCGIMLIVEARNSYAVLVVAASLIVRAFSEMPLAFARRRQRYHQSSRARAVATIISATSQTVAVSLITDPKYAPPATAIGHLTYSASLGVMMTFACGSEPFPPLTWRTFSENLLRDDLVMTAIATGEGFIKFLLENGEGIILDIVVSTPIKSAYRLSSNLGSVLCRFFSEALEEQSFNVFHRLAPSFRKESHDGGEDMRATCVDTLLLGLKAALTVSVLFALIGPAYSYALIRLLYGERWADQTPAPVMLNLYFVYLVFMSANGVSEAFVTASASTTELKARTKFATCLSSLYLAGLYYAARKYQAAGIVSVNCLNMALRTCYSIWFFARLTGQSPWLLRRAMPHPCVVLTLLAARRISRVSESYFMGGRAGFVELTGTKLLLRVASHGVSGVLVLILFGVSLFVFERQFINKVRGVWGREHED